MALNESATNVFSEIRSYMNAEQDIREEIRSVVRDLEQHGREMLAVMQMVHQPDGLKDTSAITTKARGMFEEVKKYFVLISDKLPENQYYRFHDHWRFIMQRLSFLAAFIVFLESESMIGCEDCAQMMGVKTKREEGFHIDLDDYLMGLLQLASELSRFSVNAVTAGDYNRPVKIAKFLGDLDSGFRLLNLKNDSLRKRFDALKYDLKKVEEVVYDVTIRKLASTTITPAPSGE
ncbi:hypothetical protein CAPTEDRAFT_173535 [Capitella teleta]|uniref:Translin n=1 Tax=Capitella teleta TaxID=283909 RepID=R7TI24_CAPTE|nr:hypothetical protein CAPTEDRAFT_173535 [Capitella teleta]|eukprot:ELT93478.1 hypothetical protein CAPTEDRAFT_173535 [Capitella teleta]